MFRRPVNVGLLALGCILLAQSAMSAGKPYLGISLAAKIPPALAAQLKLDGGAMIIAVAENSPAAKASLKAHDIITPEGFRAEEVVVSSLSEPVSVPSSQGGTCPGACSHPTA